MRNHQWPDRVLLQSCLTSRNSCLSVSAALWLHHWTDFLLFSFSLLHVKEELNQLYPFGTCHPSHVGTFRKPGWNVLPSSHPINLLDSCYSLGFPSTWSKTGKTFPLRLFSAALAEVELRPCPFIPTQSWQRVDSPVYYPITLISLGSKAENGICGLLDTNPMQQTPQAAGTDNRR